MEWKDDTMIVLQQNQTLLFPEWSTGQVLLIFHQTEKQIKTVVGVDTYKNLGAFLEKKNFNFSPNLIYLMTGTFATRGATWEDFCRHLRSAHLCNSHQLATLSIILNEFGFRLEKKEKVLNISFQNGVQTNLFVQINLCQKLFLLQNMGRTCCVQDLF